jgi:hypothetical protein
MITKKIEKVIISLIIINLSLVLVFSAVFERDAVPVGVLMNTSAGTVKFDHLQHTRHGTKELECASCHHSIKDTEGKERETPHSRCRSCHYKNRQVSPACNDVETHKRCIGEKCNGCHTKKRCEFCHHR